MHASPFKPSHAQFVLTRCSLAVTVTLFRAHVYSKMFSWTPPFHCALIFLPTLVQSEIAFRNYPNCSRAIYLDHAPDFCNIDLGSANPNVANTCLCSNVGYHRTTATAIFQACGCAELKSSAQIASNNCAKSGTNMATGVEEYIAAGGDCDAMEDNNATRRLDAGAIVGIVFGVLGALLVMFFGLVQLAVMYFGLTDQLAPLPVLRRLLYCCGPQQRKETE